MSEQANNAKDFVDDVAEKAHEAVDKAHDKTQQAIDDADDKARTIRDELRPAIDALNARVQDLASRTRQAACDKRDQTKETVQAYADRTSAYVVEQPLKSVAIAAAAGAVLALLLGRRH
ncbi:hypothetical protein CCO03_13690 [Comamonas serinivorans]|uniref:DUF883 domain-containing protein n=1 Tax=Comamonas serinivorans TaxID=1082851 RepID=A0A1Y0EPM3_9BURK|nr:DUF883 family protein [Comamonas serinivorans]ARU05595.1 hypothetical protein CCO03_13690 [Comamonas serinivorans]